MKYQLINGFREYTHITKHGKIQFVDGGFETENVEHIKTLGGLPFVKKLEDCDVETNELEEVEGEPEAVEEVTEGDPEEGDPEAEEPVETEAKELSSIPRNWTIARIYKEADDRNVTFPDGLKTRAEFAEYLLAEVNKG